MKTMSEMIHPLVLAKEQYQQAGIPFPYIPPEMTTGVTQLDEWVFGTRQDVSTLYNLDFYLKEALTIPVQDYVLFGQDGHGMNSYAMHYYLVRGPLAIFSQLEWGGAYTSPDAANHIVESYGQIKALIFAAEKAQAADAIAAGERLFVVNSDFTGSFWRRLRGYDEGVDALELDRWHKARDPIAAVLKELNSL